MRCINFIVAACVLTVGNSLSAFNAPPCFTQVETQFFQKASVEQALSLYNVPQASWQNITNDLQGEVNFIVQRLPLRASGMHPNPLQPFNKKGAGDLLRSQLYDSLVKILDRYGIRDDVVRQGVFQALREHNADLLKLCFDENVKVMK